MCALSCDVVEETKTEQGKTAGVALTRRRPLSGKAEPRLPCLVSRLQKKVSPPPGFQNFAASPGGLLRFHPADYNLLRSPRRTDFKARGKRGPLKRNKSSEQRADPLPWCGGARLRLLTDPCLKEPQPEKGMRLAALYAGLPARSSDCAQWDSRIALPGVLLSAWSLSLWWQWSSVLDILVIGKEGYMGWFRGGQQGSLLWHFNTKKALFGISWRRNGLLTFQLRSNRREESAFLHVHMAAVLFKLNCCFIKGFLSLYISLGTGHSWV